MRRDSSPTDRSDNFDKRLKQTMNSELDPEMVTPMTTGEEELDYADEKYPIVEQFKQTNMFPGGRRPRDTQRQAGKDND